MDATRSAKAFAWALFFLTGFSGLVYEVLWNKSLALVFGNTVFATSTVLAAFMGGLALGAYLFGRVADRMERPLLLYAALEGVVAVSALVFPYVLQWTVPLLQSLYQNEQHTLLAIVRFAVAFGFLLVPTSAMGGSLPALARFLTRADTAGRTLAFLYGINTIGATLGTAAAGFLLIPRWGLDGSLALAVGLNLFVTAVAGGFGFFARIRPQDAEGQADAEAPVEAPPLEVSRLDYRLVLIAFGISGALALGLEVLWSRALLLVFGSTVYSFTTMLMIFLAGLAVGSAVFGLFVNRLRNPILAFGLVEAGIGLVTLASIARIDSLPSLFLDGLLAHGFEWGTYLSQKVLISAGILFPLAFLFGATFPLVARIEVSRDDRIGGQVGILYAFNTIGAIFGSLFAGFVLLPAIGVQNALIAVALTAVSLGLILILSRPLKAMPSLRIFASLVLAAVAVGAAIGISPWDQKLLSAGVYFHPQNYMDAGREDNVLDEALGKVSIVEYVEGLTETAAVVEREMHREFLVDGKVEASSHFVDMRLQRLMGHLPMLFTEHPSKAVNIGLGCGITLGAVSVHPIEKLHCVELEVKITETCRYFAEYNHEVMDHPRLDVIINDGRNHLLLTDHQYDVITSDPFEPLVGGAANLYTLEHFENGRARLTPGGIFCQYLPMYQLAPEDFQMIIRTFCKVYPHVSLWYTGIDTILLGSEDPHEVSLESLTDRFRTEAVRTSLEDVGVANPVHLLQTFVMDPKKIPDIVGSGRLNTDRNPYIEYSAPRSHLMNTTAMNLAWLLRNYHPENLPLDTSTEGARAAAAQAAEQGRWVMEAALARFEGDFLRSLEASRRAVALDPENRTSLYELTAAANLHALRLLDQGEADAAKALLDEGFAGGEELLTTYVNYATWAFKTGDFPAAQDFLEKAHELNPQVPENTLKMAICSSQMGDLKEAERWCDEALDLNPRFRRARLLKADILRKRGDSAGALALYEEILEKDPIRAVAPDWIQVGDLYVKERAPTKAKRAYENATSADASNFVGWYKLARTAHLLGDRRTASDALNRAWRLKPSLVEQWVGTDPTLRDTGYLNLPVFAAPQEQGQPSSQGAPSAGQP